jgi:hypothetical protein
MTLPEGIHKVLDSYELLVEVLSYFMISRAFYKIRTTDARTFELKQTVTHCHSRSFYILYAFRVNRSDRIEYYSVTGEPELARLPFLNHFPRRRQLQR